MIIKSTVRVGFTAGIKKELAFDNIIHSHKLLLEDKAQYENLPLFASLWASSLSELKHLLICSRYGAIKSDIEIAISESAFESDDFFDFRVINDLAEIKTISYTIVARQIV